MRLFCKLPSKQICRFKLILSFKLYVHKKKKKKTISLYPINESQVDTAKCLWRSMCCGCHYSEPVHPSVNSGSHFSPIDPVCPTVKNNCNKHLKRTNKKRSYSSTGVTITFTPSNSLIGQERWVISVKYDFYTQLCTFISKKKGRQDEVDI